MTPRYFTARVLVDALKAEGVWVPDGTRDVRLVLKPGEVPTIEAEIMLDAELAGKLSRALARVAESIK